MRQHLSFKTLLVIATVTIVSTAFPVASQLPPPDGAKPKSEKEAELSAEEEATRRAAEKLVGTIEVEIQNDDKWTKVKRIDKPLLLFGDATREYVGGSFWAWGEKGRPVAVLELFRNAGMKRWTFGLTNTSGGKVRASRAGEPWWIDNDSDVVLKDVPQAPAPAADTAQRQRQLKLLCQKFTAYELWEPNNTRYDLRRLERPVHTYRDEDHGLLDGGLFVFANGTNPELLLFLEARADQKDKTKAVWQYLVGRAAGAELHLDFDGKEVFDAPRSSRLKALRRPYWAGGIDAEPDSQK